MCDVIHQQPDCQRSTPHNLLTLRRVIGSAYGASLYPSTLCAWPFDQKCQEDSADCRRGNRAGISAETDRAVLSPPALLKSAASLRRSVRRGARDGTLPLLRCTPQRVCPLNKYRSVRRRATRPLPFCGSNRSSNRHTGSGYGALSRLFFDLAVPDHGATRRTGRGIVVRLEGVRV